MALLRLLTVDDETHIHAGLDAIVDWASIGYEHIAAALNGTEALQLVEECAPHVVLTDIRMPGLDGLSLIEAIRRRGEPQPMIIVVSGYDEFEYARKALRFGVHDYLLKPIDEEELARVLGEIRRRISTPHVEGSGGADESAVRLVLAGSGSDAAIEAADREIAEVRGDRLCAMVCIYRLRDTIDAPPLRASAVRVALSEGKASDSAQWAVDDDTGVVAPVLIPPSARGGDTYRAWMKGLKNSIERKVEFPTVLVASEPFGDSLMIRDTVVKLRERVYDLPLSKLGELRIVSEARTGRVRRLSAGGMVFALEDADGDAARASANSVVSAAVDESVPVKVVAEWLAEIRVEVGRLLADLGGESAVNDAAMRRVVRHVHELAPSAILKVVEGYLTSAAGAVSRLRDSSRDGVVALMRRRIERDFAGDLSISSMAQQYGMNPVYLGQLFKKRSGQGFKTALRRRRVREARLLLETTDLLVPDIARAVGYKDTDFFSDQFKRETGLTPGQYRGHADS